MNLFDQLVGEAFRSRGDLTTLRPVVEKELLHHDILLELSGAGLLTSLNFNGGTCLRASYGSPLPSARTASKTVISGTSRGWSSEVLRYPQRLSP